MLRISACSTEKCLKCDGFNEPFPLPYCSSIFFPVFLWAIACDLNSKQLGISENQDMCCVARPGQVAVTSKRCKGSPGIPAWASLQGQAVPLLELAWPVCGVMMSRSITWPSPWSANQEYCHTAWHQLCLLKAMEERCMEKHCLGNSLFFLCSQIFIYLFLNLCPG